MRLSQTVRHFWQFTFGYCLAVLLVSAIHAILFGNHVGLVALGVMILLFAVMMAIAQPLFVPYRVRQWTVEPISLLDWPDYDWSEVEQRTAELAELGFLPLQDYSHTHQQSGPKMIARCFGNANLGSFAEMGFYIKPIETDTDNPDIPAQTPQTKATDEAIAPDTGITAPEAIASSTEVSALITPDNHDRSSAVLETETVTDVGLALPSSATESAITIVKPADRNIDRPRPQITYTVFFSIFEQGWMLIDGNFAPHPRESLIYAWRNPREVRHYYPRLGVKQLCIEHIGHRQTMMRRLRVNSEQTITWDTYREIQQELITQPWLRLRRRNLLSAMIDATRFERRPLHEWLGEYSKVLNQEISKF